MIAVTSDWREVDSELDRLIAQPSPKIVAMLDSLLATGFAATQVAVHVDTHSLRPSGKSSSEVNEATHTWTGTIAYGGESPGVNNPVTYAIYEKARGGAHDFMAPLPALDPLYVAAIKETLGR